jgi:hypothetical protein
VYQRIETGAASYEVEPTPTFDLELVRDGAHWLVRDLPSGIHGCGDAPTDALDDFMRAVREHLDVLERQGALTDALAAQLDYLRSRIPGN